MKNLPIIGAVVSAMLGVSCCILPAILAVMADHKKGLCSVKYQKGKVSIEDIIKAINRAGYKAKMRKMKRYNSGG